MKILVLGGAGYIGAHAVLELLDANHSVVVFDDFSTGEKLNIDIRAEIFEGSILSKKDLKSVFKNYSFDFVMHFCALKSPYESMIYPDKYSETNIVGTLNILNQMLRSKVNNFIFSSSCSVYGEPTETFVDENHQLEPVSYYGFTKLEIERILKWYSNLTDLKFISLRYFNAAGYDLKSRIKVPEIKSENLIPNIMKVLLGKQETLKIFGSDYNTKDGTCIRDYIHVNDIANAHLKSLDFFKNNLESIFFNLATGEGHSVLEVLKEVEKQSGCKINYEFKEKREGDPSMVISSSKHKKSILNWEPVNSNLESIISSVLSIYNFKK